MDRKEEEDSGDRWTCAGSEVKGQRSRRDARGRHSSRFRPASRESTSARGARQKVKDVNWDRKSCRETDGHAGQAGAAAAVFGPHGPTRRHLTRLILALTDLVLLAGVHFPCGAPGRLLHQAQVLQLRQVQLRDGLPPEQEGVVLAARPVHHLRVWGQKHGAGGAEFWYRNRD